MDETAVMAATAAAATAVTTAGGTSSDSQWTDMKRAATALEEVEEEEDAWLGASEQMTDAFAQAVARNEWWRTCAAAAKIDRKRTPPFPSCLTPVD
ncbi:hypothetical protein THASP1DRAFT_33378 [Thamnocephalis sphaerospora]|uniref:Uncharacterized protein n=1 Tax=Thamnocephalis sphaerospora TaxID=78915 RepID=A0A4P9XGR0_9FUNG|nr:hypothetical protein THASP1DRAFT_33378 [Thamnocephalis sphaerospora]|eukprot:RKP04812.1 hypothetical protein THASP1DRAFT_33378 [Thamnocephalis sphaerospora]